jgi:hypothetical protein
MSAKDQAAKRLLEQQVEELVKEGSDESGSPKKKVRRSDCIVLFHTKHSSIDLPFPSRTSL